MAVRSKNFRQDLYFRLKTVSILVPALVDHTEDIFDLVERFGFEFTAKNDIPYKGFDQGAIDLMKNYDWPGNVRELKNTVESLLVMNMIVMKYVVEIILLLNLFVIVMEILHMMNAVNVAGLILLVLTAKGYQMVLL